MINRLPLILLLLMPCLLYAESNPAPARWYEIEIILFENNFKQESFKEVLNDTGMAPELISSIELIPPFTPTIEGERATETAYQQLAKSQLQLIDIAKKLEKKSSYKPLLHIGWRQPGLAKELAPAILIYPYPAGQPFTEEQYLNLPENRLDEENIAVTSDNLQIKSNTLSHNPLGNQSEIATNNWQQETHIFGYIRLFLSRYLHIDSDLLLSKPVEKPPHHLLLDGISTLMSIDDSDNGDYFDSPEQLLTTSTIPLRNKSEIVENHYFRINENRRLRKEELHYFDHPHFGMLLVVRDYIPPEEELPSEQVTKLTP